ncbi:hypothetical protein [uncultured Algoriphagus sp.]|uniref:hypothetical protein n=1 Tax=uncultured Algoriphagus sp. TaxID=417365 RepID=UPI0030EF41D1|tara:strand:- start:27781 stop:28605 length:825 start_codon:yes stop_codon:yes gene_type:complete
MIRVILFSFVGLFAFGCVEKAVEKPVWLNTKSTLKVNQDTLVFEAEAQDWKASLSTAVQLIYPEIVKTDGKILVIIRPVKGIIEGNAFLTLKSGTSQFVYPISLKNQEEASQLADLRSPKTLTTDSSMVQQQILYSSDPSGNLTLVNQDAYFVEKNIELLPKTGTFKSITGTARSSFYVDAGTVREIPLSYSKDSHNQEITIQAGPLVDRFDNKIANGTLILFHFQKDQQHKKVEAVVQDSFAILSLPLDEAEGKNIIAQIAQIYSQPLTIPQQ